ncbi:MAG: CHAD domain-containing protein, partial [Mobilicoccus sp.]|nr:CHAD domain-containing protein [Mobilicoccus sp.]
MGKKADKGADAATTVEPQVDVETELKFEVPRRWAMPRLEKLPQVASVDGPRRFTQTATYLDTSSLALLRGKHTLRRRTGGTDAGWHLKTPSTADDGARVEHRLPLGRSAAIVPPVLHDLVADLAGGDALVPVARLRTRRTRRTLRDSAGAALVLVEDDVVEATTFVDGERVLRWREIEVELADGGTAADLQAVSEALIEAGLTPSDSPSKLSRALAQPLEGITSTKKKNLTAGDVVLSYLSQQIGVLQASEQRLRDDEPDAVHKARVATRRLRSTLRSYRALLHRGETDDLRAEVKWLTGVLGGPRDGEVMLERL